MVKDVGFRTGQHPAELYPAELYPAEVARILASAGGDTRGGMRLMPLVRDVGGSVELRDAVTRLAVPQSVKAGLYLYCSYWEEAHTTADAVEDPDGYFWHAIVHRQEPDPGNSAYWFRRTGNHPIFPKLAEEAAACGYQTDRTGETWDPFRFIEFCDTAATGSGQEHLAMKVQLVEWQLLFDHCVRGSAI
jgi:hypothetical protein